jgi:hypothetical protein
MAAPDFQLPGQYASLVVDQLPPDYAPTRDAHIPLDHATTLASPPGGPPVATVGMTPQPMPPQPPSPTSNINPYQYLLNKGQNLNAHGLNPEFASRLTQAIQAAESATGHQAVLRDLYRPPEQQAQYYADYTRQPVTFNGVTYQPNPNNQGGLAAPPGRSRHALGQAADVNSGPVLDYLHQNAGRFGLEFLKNNAFQADPGHIQLSSGQTLSVPAGNQQYNITGGGGSMPGISSLAQMRQAKFATELNDPNTRRLFAASVAAEVGGQGPRAEQAYIESVMNRSLSRGMTLQQAIQDAHYYPSTTTSKLGQSFDPGEQNRINNMIGYAMQGSNVGNFTTGNESGNVHSGGAPVAFDPGTGERFVHENADADWIKMVMGGAGGTYSIPTAGGGVARRAGGGALIPVLTPEDVPTEEQSEPDQELAALKPQLEALKTPTPTPTPPPTLQPAVATPTPDLPPVNLQPAVTPGFPGTTTPDQDTAAALAYANSLNQTPQQITVTGADGQLHTIDAGLAAVDPTIGMTKGIANSPQVKAEELAGVVPRLDQIEPEPSTLTKEQIDSMTHGAKVASQLPTVTPQYAQATKDILHAFNPIGIPGVVEPGHALSDIIGEYYPDWMKAIGKFEQKEGVQTAEGLIGGVGELPKLPKTGLARATTGLSDTKAAELTTALGNNAAFQPVYQSLKELPRETVVDIANKFNGPVAPSTSKNAALSRILSRHNKLSEFQSGEAPASTEPGPIRDAATGRLRDPPTGQFVAEPPGPGPKAGSSSAIVPGSWLETLTKPERTAEAERLATEEPITTIPSAERPVASPIAELESLKEPLVQKRSGKTVTPAVPPAKPVYRSAAEEAAAQYAERMKLGAPPAEMRIPQAQPVPTLPVRRTRARIPGVPPRVAVPATPVTPTTPAPPAFPPLTQAQMASAIPAELLPPAAPSVAAPPAPPIPQATPPAATPPSTPSLPPATPPAPRLTQTPTVQSPVPPPPPPLPPGLTQAPRGPIGKEAGFGLGAFTRFGDDLMGPVKSFMEKAGVDETTLKRMREVFKHTTGSQAAAIAEAATNHGHAISPEYNFKADVPLYDLGYYMHKNPEFRNYIHLKDTLDDIHMKEQAQRGGPNQQNLPLAHPQYGPISVRGETRQSATRKVGLLDQAHPDFAAQQANVRKYMAEIRRAEAEGEYGLHTKQELADMNAHNANEIPWHGREYGENGTALDKYGKPIERGDPYRAIEGRQQLGAREKMSNAAKMSAIDVIRSSPHGQTMFRYLTQAEANALPPRKRMNLVTGERRGVTENWLVRNSTMAQALDLDPRMFTSNAVAAITGATNRLFTSTTTGLLSHFALTDVMRNAWIMKRTIAGTRKGWGPGRLIPPASALPWHPQHISAPGYIFGRNYIPFGPGSLPHAIARPNIQKMAEYARFSFKNTPTGKWLQQKLGPTATNHISTVLAHAQHKGAAHMVEAMGAHASGMMSPQHETWARGVDALGRKAKQFMNNPKYRHLSMYLQAYKNAITSVHGAANYAFLERNLPSRKIFDAMTPQEQEKILAPLFSMGNDLAGNPKTAGIYYKRHSGPVRYDMEDELSIPKSAIARTLKGIAARGIQYGWIGSNQLGREWSPWHNMILQGGKALYRSVATNPTETALRWALYGTGTSGLAYLWNAALGKDPDGIPYVWHMMYGRSEYSKAMSQYLGLPGERVADGVELPLAFQEDVGPKMMTEAAMDHLYGNNAWNWTQDMKAAAANWADIAAFPPTPAFISDAFAAAGVQAPQNIGGFLPSSLFSGLGQNSQNADIGGDVYKKKNSPFDQNRVVGQSGESYLRTLAPTIADMLLGAGAAFVHTPGGYGEALKNAVKQAGKPYIQGLPVIRNIAGVLPPLSGMTRYTQEMYNRQQAIEQLDEFYRKYELTGVRDVVRKKPLSKGGEAIATQAVGPHLPHHTPGLDQPEPTNPLYIEFAKELYNLTKHDSPRTGGHGYRSLWDRYREATEGIQSMQKIDYGNMGPWHNNLVANKPDVVDRMKEAGINHKDPRQVRNYWEHQRQRVAIGINNAISEIEDKFNSSPMGQDFFNTYGRRLRIDDLDPYGLPSGAFQQGTTPKANTPKTEEFVPGARRTLPWGAPPV